MLLIILLFLFSTQTAMAQVNPDEIVKLTNDIRVERNLKPLKVSHKLTIAATNKANDILKKDYWAHISPEGVTPWYWIKNSGYRYSYAGENLANGFDNATTTINAWMKSPTHKQNIVSNKLCEIGVAAVTGNLNGKETTVVVQMMACPKRGISTIIENAKKYFLG